MRILTGETEYTGASSVLALGMFDGVHIGHQRLIRTAVEIAAARSAEPVVVSFDDHPQKALGFRSAPYALTDVASKIEMFERLGVRTVLLRPFTREFADIPAEAYLRMLASTLRPCAIVAGYNYTFGKGGAGDTGLIASLGKSLGFEAVIESAILYEGLPVSSTAIRACLCDGELTRVSGMLGRFYRLSAHRVAPERYAASPGLAMPRPGLYSVLVNGLEARIEILPDRQISAPGFDADALKIDFQCRLERF